MFCSTMLLTLPTVKFVDIYFIYVLYEGHSINKFKNGELQNGDTVITAGA